MNAYSIIPLYGIAWKFHLLDATIFLKSFEKTVTLCQSWFKKTHLNARLGFGVCMTKYMNFVYWLPDFKSSCGTFTVGPRTAYLKQLRQLHFWNTDIFCVAFTGNIIIANLCSFDIVIMFGQRRLSKSFISETSKVCPTKDKSI